MSRTKLVMVTGATSGIGAAVAKAFCASGANVFLLGRNARRLSAAAARLPAARVAGTERVDLGSLAELRSTLAALAQRLRRVDVLVHAAGEYGWTEPGSLDTDGFDLLFDVNVRAPYLLTQGLMPQLARAQGQVIFINSSVVRSLGQGVAAFKATQHAVQGLVDSLRQDFNGRGVRIASVFPGRTATPRMRRIYARQNRKYTPNVLLIARDVAALIVAIAATPRAVEITDVHLRSPTPY